MYVECKCAYFLFNTYACYIIVLEVTKKKKKEKKLNRQNIDLTCNYINNNVFETLSTLLRILENTI